jgi:hypothetical protein
MISSADADVMTYRDYKVEVWRRLCGFWVRYGEDHPNQSSYANERLTVCHGWLEHWLAVNAGVVK